MVDSLLEDDIFDDEQPLGFKVSVPALEQGFASYGDFALVGHGSVTNDNCGKFRGFYGCVRVEKHDIIASDGVNYKGKVYVRRVRFSCGKPSCPICYLSGWAVREAGRIEGRLVEASRHFGLVEHIVCSVPLRDYGLSFEGLRLKAVKVLAVRGVIGGVLIFHGFRYNLRKHWYWSPHFHVLGFILGGYKCRGCDKFCSECKNGFEVRTRREFEKDGYIVKVLGKRKTVFGTAWYQLNHASVKVGVEHFRVATWFGICSYRKLKVTVEHKRSFCPICENDLQKLRFNGNGFVMDANLSSGKREFFADAVDECGFAVWVVDVNAVHSG